MQKQEILLKDAPEEETIIQFIVFLAGNEEFGVPIDAVREIIKMGIVTPIPNSPAFIKGIVNVRGEIVTAIDVKLQLSLPATPNVEAKHIIVTKQADGLFGLIVDEVAEVLRIKKNEIKPPPSLVMRIHKKYIKGILSYDSRLIILLDIPAMLSEDELMKFSSLQKIKPTKKNNKTNETQNINHQDSDVKKVRHRTKRKQTGK